MRIATIAVLLLAACSYEKEPTAASQTPLVCTADSCFSCAEVSTCQRDRCPEAVPWCDCAADPCPGGLSQTFCDGNPDWNRCVFVSYSVCDESTSVWCCASEPLESEWFCDTPADCPDATECMVPECWPFHHPFPGPNGEQKKCSYNLVAEGTPCSTGTCQYGVCRP